MEVGVLPGACMWNPCDMWFPLVPAQTQRHVIDLYEDLRDGHNLISLLEVLSGETLVSIATMSDLTLEVTIMPKLCNFYLNCPPNPD